MVSVDKQTVSHQGPYPRENMQYGEKVILARRLFASWAVVQYYYIYLSPIFSPTCTKVFLSIPLYKTIIVTIRHRLASLARQVHLLSIHIPFCWAYLPSLSIIGFVYLDRECSPQGREVRFANQIEIIYKQSLERQTGMVLILDG